MRKKKTIVIIHRNFPGQFERLTRQLIQDGHVVVGIGHNPSPQSLEPMPEALRYFPYQALPQSPEHVHPFAWTFEGHLRRATGVAKLALALREGENLRPDLVLAHTGWGEALLLKEVWPSAEYVGFFEYYYSGRQSDVDFDPEFAPSIDDIARAEFKNATPLLSLDFFDRGYCPTQWQRSTYPSFAQSKLSVIHDGIDTDKASPRPDLAIRLGGKRFVRADAAAPIVSFVARSLEPYRGIHTFVRAIPEIQRQLPSAQIVVVGEESSSYGKPRADGQSHFKFYMDQVKRELDLSRVHVLGNVSHDVLMGILQASSAHVYLTYPFVLSWSMLEAMSCGATVVGSDVPPVREVIEHGKTGYLVDFFDHKALAQQVVQACKKPNAKISQAARQAVVERFDWKSASLPQFQAFLGVGPLKVGKTTTVELEPSLPAARKPAAKKPAAKKPAAKKPAASKAAQRK